MKQNTIETVVGALVLLIAAWFLTHALRAQEHEKKGEYELIARFTDVEGLAQGSAIRLSGVKVGTIGKITLDPKYYQAVVRLEIEPEVRIPDDTLATVATPGLLGEKYMSLEPGSSETMLKNGDTITNTQSAASIEKLLGQVIFSLSNLGKSSGDNAAPKPASP
jgi:phospholipid/cholesterol/gamma-HCH transport system substrate-binding protein